jgi:hypothetical protein
MQAVNFSGNKLDTEGGQDSSPRAMSLQPVSHFGHNPTNNKIYEYLSKQFLRSLVITVFYSLLVSLLYFSPWTNRNFFRAFFASNDLQAFTPMHNNFVSADQPSKSYLIDSAKKHTPGTKFQPLADLDGT